MLAHTTAIRNECYATREQSNLLVIYCRNYNNNGTRIEQLINELAVIGKPPKEEDMEKTAIKLLDVLRFCARENKALHLKHSDHFHEDISIKRITKVAEFVANDEKLRNKWDTELDKHKLLPNFPMVKNNFTFADHEIITKEGDLIYYNAYSACNHPENPCDKCHSYSNTIKRKRVQFIRNLFC